MTVLDIKSSLLGIISLLFLSFDALNVNKENYNQQNTVPPHDKFW